MDAEDSLEGLTQTFNAHDGSTKMCGRGGFPAYAQNISQRDILDEKERSPKEKI